MDVIDDLILESLSFYEPYTMEQMILSFDEYKIEQLPNFNMLVLEERLRKLVAKKYIVRKKGFKEFLYQRRIPPKSFLQRLRFF